MDDRNLVASIFRLGAHAYATNPQEYATPADDPALSKIGMATLANWLEKLGGHRLIGDVQPYYSSRGFGFRYQATERTAEIAADDGKLSTFLDTLFPPLPKYDLFISYAAGDSAIANELRDDLQANGLTCFMAEKNIEASAEWQDSFSPGRRRFLPDMPSVQQLEPFTITCPLIAFAGRVTLNSNTITTAATKPDKHRHEGSHRQDQNQQAA